LPQHWHKIGDQVNGGESIGHRGAEQELAQARRAGVVEHETVNPHLSPEAVPNLFETFQHSCDTRGRWLHVATDAGGFSLCCMARFQQRAEFRRQRLGLIGLLEEAGRHVWPHKVRHHIGAIIAA
jgi:hypothetical protein